MAQKYSTFPILLTAAGERPLHEFTGVLRMIKAVDSTGALALDTEIEIRLGDNDGDWIPLRYGNAIKAVDTEQLTIKWTAQAGVTITLFTSRDPNVADVDADPPAQLAIGASASTIVAAAVTVAAAATAIVAVNAARKQVTIQNNDAASIWIGAAGVTVAAGLELAAGASFTTDKTTAALYGISAAGTAAGAVRTLEEGQP